MNGEARFRDREIVFANGARGEHVEVDSADPANYRAAIASPRALPRRAIDGKLFRPPRATGATPAVVVVPGSLGVAPSHLAHAEALTSEGIAAFVIDPFGARSVTSTVANQTQYSFAASAYDVLAAYEALARRADVDAARIGAQGHSRGGSAVVTASMRRFADAVAGAGRGLAAAYAAYPWCGHQFLDPAIGRTRLRAVIGDRDEWCLPQQVQAQIHAMQLRGGDASLRIFDGAQHSFDRETKIELVADASVAPAAPTAYLADDGAFVHPLTNKPDPALTDRELMIYAMKAGYGKRGARIGTEGTLAAEFRADMLRFWREALLAQRS
ncbi:MAG: dienelactone hydrolase family protein [Deltaproteobacteria bacterium]|nr:dienelactone hydrolase family protein [Deltaproteobacteria bacterium]